MKRFLFAFILGVIICFNITPNALAENTTLVPCKDSSAFLQRVKNSPDNYYFEEPDKAYSEYLLCGTDGLPHLAFDRLDRLFDAIVPIALFLYIAGFIGWSGRSYLIETRKRNNPEQWEIFIDLPLAIQSVIKGVLWPLLALQEFLSGNLTAKDEEIPISPR
jgi:photosystem I subunit 3